MRKLLFILIVAIVATSCSPQKKLNRKIKRTEAFAYKHGLTIKEPVVIRDTIVTEMSSKDTIFSVKEFFENSKDTIIIKENNLRVKIHTVRDTISISGECLSDTIFYENTVYVDKIVHKEISWWQKYKGLLLILIILGGAILVLNKLNKIGKLKS